MKSGIFIFEALRNLFSKCVTQGPQDEPDNPTRFRGTLQYNTSPCTGCGLCEQNCPSNAISVEKNNGNVVWNYDAGRCIYCSQCVEICPPDALEMENTIGDSSSEYDSFKKEYEFEM